LLYNHRMEKRLPPEQYYASLPAKRMAAGVLLLNDREEILLVHPTYKPRWDIPGGVTEGDESPRACACREMLEEIGLDRDIGRLLVVDYNERAGAKTESLMFIFDGGILPEEDIANICLQEAELDRFAFFPMEALPDAISDTLRRRMQRAFAERQNPNNAYTENQL
jgi:8-oxo-dGTP diphosphatase